MQYETQTANDLKNKIRNKHNISSRESSFFDFLVDDRHIKLTQI